MDAAAVTPFVSIPSFIRKSKFRSATRLALFGLRAGVGMIGVAMLLSGLLGCEALPQVVLPDEDTSDVAAGYSLVARFVHIGDSQIVDEESPGRLPVLGGLNASAWRPQERYSIHLLDGTIRAINALHEHVADVDFVLFAGDALDNVQHNELQWFLTAMDGGTIDPTSGVDDRPAGQRGPEPLDANLPFEAQGLYRNGVHGEHGDIPWYTVMGNHDRYAVGVLPILVRSGGRRFAPMPDSLRLGLFLPTALVPEGSVAYAPITPAHPAPPDEIVFPTLIEPNPDRRFVSPDEFVSAHFATLTQPPGHGLTSGSQTWYGVVPVPGLRLIGLDTSLAGFVVPTGDYSEGAIVQQQVEFLRRQLREAETANQWVIVATHHPSNSLTALNGTAVSPEGFRAILRSCPKVVAHLAGHSHRNRVWDRDGYLEIETSSIIDYPQQGRIIEIYSDGSRAQIRQTLFSHLYAGDAFDSLDAGVIDSDPFLDMRREAWRLGCEHARSFGLIGTDVDCQP